MTYEEYNRKINRLFDRMVTSSREERPAIEREIKKLEALAESQGLDEEEDDSHYETTPPMLDDYFKECYNSQDLYETGHLRP